MLGTQPLRGGKADPEAPGGRGGHAAGSCLWLRPSPEVWPWADRVLSVPLDLCWPEVSSCQSLLS